MANNIVNSIESFKSLFTSLNISSTLKEVGFNKKSNFSYYKTYNDDIIIAETDLNSELKFICYAYLFDELIKELPPYIKISESSYVPSGPFSEKWIKVSDIVDEDETDFVANFEFYYADENSFVIRYAFRGKVVALRIDSKGKYCNLVLFGDSPADVAAKMVLYLISEDVINFIK